MERAGDGGWSVYGRRPNARSRATAGVSDSPSQCFAEGHRRLGRACQVSRSMTLTAPQAGGVGHTTSQGFGDLSAETPTSLKGSPRGLGLFAGLGQDPEGHRILRVDPGVRKGRPARSAHRVSQRYRAPMLHQGQDRHGVGSNHVCDNPAVITAQETPAFADRRFDLGAGDYPFLPPYPRPTRPRRWPRAAPTPPG
jgi:hypothetical protein